MSAAGIQAEREMQAHLQRIRETEGEEAYQRAKAGWNGFKIGALGAAASGAALGTLFMPGIGTGLGLVIGLILGGSEGGRDSSKADNIKTAEKAAWRALRAAAGQHHRS